MERTRMDKVKEKVIEHFKNVMEIETNVDIKLKLIDLGMDSLTYIKFIVDLEEEFSMEFEDEMLDVGGSKSVYDIIQYIKSNKIIRNI